MGAEAEKGSTAASPQHGCQQQHSNSRQAAAGGRGQGAPIHSRLAGCSAPAVGAGIGVAAASHDSTVYIQRVSILIPPLSILQFGLGCKYWFRVY